MLIAVRLSTHNIMVFIGCWSSSDWNDRFLFVLCFNVSYVECEFAVGCERCSNHTYSFFLNVFQRFWVNSGDRPGCFKRLGSKQIVVTYVFVCCFRLQRNCSP